jgi:hypothetical protein
MNQSGLKEVAIAIIARKGKFLIQLRDDIPTIVYPGYWALFGGHLENFTLKKIRKYHCK